MAKKHRDSQIITAGSITDVRTGDKFNIHINKRRGASYDDRFTLMFNFGIEKLLQATLRPTSWKIFFWLFSTGDFKSYTKIRQASLALELNVHRPAISKGLKQLVDAGLVEKMAGRGASHFRISIEIGWRGNAQQFQMQKRKIEKAKDYSYFGEDEAECLTDITVRELAANLRARGHTDEEIDTFLKNAVRLNEAENRQPPDDEY